MSKPSYNPYQAPSAELNGTASGEKSILNFTRFSAWGVFGLSMITLGIYPIYWLYTRVNISNQAHPRKISSNLTTSLVIVTILSFAGELLPKTDMGLAAAALISIAYIVLLLIVSFSLKARLEDIMEKSSGSARALSGVMTFFFNAIYLQYKINETIDIISLGEQSDASAANFQVRR